MTEATLEEVKDVEQEQKQPTELEALRSLVNHILDQTSKFITDRHAAGGGISQFERDAFLGQLNANVGVYNKAFPQKEAEA